jgi:hypothetical protein
LPDAIVIHPALLTASHAQLLSQFTLIVPLPPLAGYVIAVGAMT